MDFKATITRGVDGDTFRALLSKTTSRVVGPGWAQTITDFSCDALGNPADVSIRLIILDTPERGQVGYREARDDLVFWMAQHAGHLRVELYGGTGEAGWSRALGDLYVEGDRGNTATQFMLMRGWPTYLG